ncbi:MAG: hypothetical protein AAFO98_12265 [Pseudomonadota bacterium]
MDEQLEFGKLDEIVFCRSALWGETCAGCISGSENGAVERAAGIVMPLAF